MGPLDAILLATRRRSSDRPEPAHTPGHSMDSRRSSFPWDIARGRPRARAPRRPRTSICTRWHQRHRGGGGFLPSRFRQPPPPERRKVPGINSTPSGGIGFACHNLTEQEKRPIVIRFRSASRMMISFSSKERSTRSNNARRIQNAPGFSTKASHAAVVWLLMKKRRPFAAITCTS